MHQRCSFAQVICSAPRRRLQLRAFFVTGAGLPKLRSTAARGPCVRGKYRPSRTGNYRDFPVRLLREGPGRLPPGFQRGRHERAAMATRPVRGTGHEPPAGLSLQRIRTVSDRKTGLSSSSPRTWAACRLRADGHALRPFVGIADFAHEIERIIDEEGTEKSHIAICQVALKPEFRHTAPGGAGFTIVVRDLDDEVIAGLANVCRRVPSSIARRHKPKFDYEQGRWPKPAICDPRYCRADGEQGQGAGLFAQAHAVGRGPGQGVLLRPHQGVAALRALGPGGSSHAPDERTHWCDCERGCHLLLECVLELACEDAPVAA